MKGHILTPKALGAYLVLAALYQVGIYLWHGGPPFLIDPRLGVGMLLVGVLHLGDRFANVIEWVSGIWLLCLGSFIIGGRQVLKTYIVSEVLLAMPTLLYLVVFTSGGHMGAATPVEAVPFWLLFMAFSGVPVCLAIYCLRRGAKQASGRVNG